MNLTLHLIRKDARRLAWPLALWLALIAADVGLGVLLADGPLGVWEQSDWIKDGHNLLLGLQVVISIMLTVQLVQEDPLIGTRAFWPTRPISRSRLLSAKLLGLVVLLWLPPLLVLFPWWLSSGFGPGDLAQAALETILLQALITLPAWVLASVTRSLLGFLGWAVATLLAVFAAIVFNVQIHPPERGSHMDVPDMTQYAWSVQNRLVRWLLVAIFVTWLAAGLRQFLTGQVRRSRGMIVLGWAALLGLGLLPWNWLAIFVRDIETLTTTLMRPAREVPGFMLRLGGAKVVLDSDQLDQQLQLQFVVDQPPPSLVAFPWSAEMVWSWPDEPNHFSRRLTLQDFFGSGLEQSLFAQFLAPNPRFDVPLRLMETMPGEDDPSRNVPVEELLAGSHHAVSTQVKLAVWAVGKRLEAPLRPDAHDAHEPGRFRLRSVTFDGASADKVMTVDVVVTGSGPDPVLPAILQPGREWDHFHFIALVNRTRTVFALEQTEGSFSLWIGGVGLNWQAISFPKDDFYPVGEVLATPPQRYPGTENPAFPGLDKAWFDGATVMDLELNPLGWVGREATDADLKVPDYVPLRTVPAAGQAAKELSGTDYGNVYNTVLFRLHPELRTMLQNVQNLGSQLVSLGANGALPVMAGPTRAFTTALDTTIARLDVIATTATETTAAVTLSRRLEDQLNAVKRKLP